jgi:hypothetical protein
MPSFEAFPTSSPGWPPSPWSSEHWSTWVGGPRVVRIDA